MMQPACALFAQDARQLARIDAGDGDDAMLFQVVRQRFLQTPALGANRQVADDQAGSKIGTGLEILRIAADIADMRDRSA
jgi:hypothetical protein